MKKHFRTYLENQGFSSKTQAQYQKTVTDFLAYQNQPAEQVSYQDVLKYVAYLQDLGYSAAYINAALNRIRHYYKALQLDTNPAAGIIIKGKKRKLIHNLLTHSELVGIYEGFEGSLAYRVLLSLLIFQGLHPSDFPVLQSTDIELIKAKIHLPGSPKTEARSLNIAAAQILLLHQYLEEKKHQKTLFKNPTGISNQLARLFKKLRQSHPEVRNSLQIRASVISHWLRGEDLRIVQYKAGHRYVSSTERYQSESLDQLQADLDQYHPLEK